MIATICKLILLTIPFIKPELAPPVPEGNTTLAIKQGIQDYTDSIPSGISDFKELVRKSKIFIDNTLFIKEILQGLIINRIRLAICSPSQWGKTTLLTMLQTFLQIQTDEHGNRISPKESASNYKLFKGEILHDDGKMEKLQTPLLIANDEKSMKYLGEYPVIYLSFKNAIGQTYDDIERNISLAVHRAIKQHDYMLNVLNNSNYQNDLQEFKGYLLETEQLKFKLGSLPYMLEFFDGILHRHFGRHCYLLIDDYDTPFHSFLEFHQFASIEENHCYQLLNDIIAFVAKSNYKQLILAGRFAFRFEENALKQVHISDNYIFDESRDSRLCRKKFRQYFGFKEQHVQFLFDLHNISTTLAQRAKAWYNGYQSEDCQYNYYNPVSIVKFLSRKEIACYRSLDQYDAFIQTTFAQDSETVNKVLKLLSKQTPHEFSVYAFIYSSSFTDIRSYYTFQRTSAPNCPIYTNDMILDIILWTEDYLTGTYTSKQNALPNNEVSFLMSTWLITYYKRKYYINDTLLNNAAASFLDFFNSQQKTTLKDSLEELYKHSFCNISTITSKKSEKQDSYHCILNCVALTMQCLSKFQLDIYYNNLKTADLVIHDNRKQQAIVVQLCENQSTARSALYSANKIAKNLQLPNPIRQVYKIGINVLANKSVAILSSSKSLV